MLTVYPNTIIYFLCAPNFATGGPEALHQMAYHLNKLGFKAVMYYEPQDHSDNPVHPFYVKYNIPYVREVENNTSHILILPETSLDPLFEDKFSEIRLAIWWLSVTNYYLRINPKIRRTKRKLSYWLRKLYKPVQFATFENIKALNIANIAHSYFSKVHLQEQGITPMGQISDYMNHAFFDLFNPDIKKEDIIIYNPKKNNQFLDSIMKLCPALNWVPLIDLTPTEVAEWMNKAKLYIDFGYHPGKERMPRESCIMNCCMIIGKDGSAKYAEDMPILEKYRFEKKEENIDQIIETIHSCLNNYDEEIKNFANYRAVLFNEENKFIEDINKVFIKG
ncbi:MAG: hypothetical protein EOO93_12935 [Pedobacter sp.]|nr:MAG: hypothetical protein EOO93_12935 [Pedobacter sp.]